MIKKRDKKEQEKNEFDTANTITTEPFNYIIEESEEDESQTQPEISEAKFYINARTSQESTFSCLILLNYYLWSMKILNYLLLGLHPQV